MMQSESESRSSRQISVRQTDHVETCRNPFSSSSVVSDSHSAAVQCLCMTVRSLNVELSLTGFSTPQSKPLQGLPFAHQQPDSFLPLSYHGYPSLHFDSAASSSVDASSAMRAGASLLESSALWDVPYSPHPARLCVDLSSGSSGYQSGTSHTGRIPLKRVCVRAHGEKCGSTSASCGQNEYYTNKHVKTRFNVSQMKL